MHICPPWSVLLLLRKLYEALRLRTSFSAAKPEAISPAPAARQVLDTLAQLGVP
jgi:hypothetical protein